MIRGLYTSTIGMLAEELKQNNVTNNIANVNTPGYKKSELVISTFEETLMSKFDAQKGVKNGMVPLGSVSQGIQIDDQVHIWSAGDLEETGNTTDLALAGDGFFTIDGEAGLKYTRNGAFKLDAEGYLLTQTNEGVLGQRGLIQVNPNNFTIVETGDVYSDGELVDRILITDFADKNDLRKVGNDFFVPKEDARGEQVDSPMVKQKFLEKPNFSLANEIVNMMIGMRTYEANQRAIQVHDQILGKSVNELGSVR